MDKRKLGEKIKRAFQWTAKSVHVRTILYEMREQLVRWYRLDKMAAEAAVESIQLPETYKPSAIRESLLNSQFITREGEVDILEAMKDNLGLRALMPGPEAAFVKDRFAKFNIPSDRYIIAFNPPTSKPMYLHIAA